MMAETRSPRTNYVPLVKGKDSVLNSVWDGSKVVLFGAKNEVVSFNLVIEAGAGPAPDTTVAVEDLSGPQGFLIESAPALR